MKPNSKKEVCEKTAPYLSHMPYKPPKMKKMLVEKKPGKKK